MYRFISARKISWLLPYRVRRVIKFCLSTYVFLQESNIWIASLFASTVQLPKINLFYGHLKLPKNSEIIHGGMVKFQRLQEVFRNSPTCFNILYLGSSSLPRDWRQIYWLARRRKAKLVVNQNGVAYPGWHGPGWDEKNRPLRKLVHEADYVFYQSRFCKLSADRFLGERKGSWEILFNCVDTKFFTPAKREQKLNGLTILLGGSQYHLDRVETALRTLAILSKKLKGIRLIVTGKLSWIPDEKMTLRIFNEMVREMGISEKVELLGPYAQSDAPKILRKAQILLHTKYNDPCPGVVIEAMACGLPVVYSKSGGVPELVGEKAGVGIAAKCSFEEYICPEPEELADGVLSVVESLGKFAMAARQRAVEKFDIQPWLKRHQEVFEALLDD